MPDDQSNIPTRPVPPPSPAAEGITPVLAAAMLGAARPAGGPWQPPSPEELQRDFPLYEIRGILGRGGMGAVYKGWQNSLDRLVAIKILPPDLEDGISGFTERFKREAKSMAQLEHPGIVAVYDAGTTSSGLLYFVMQCITGTDVQKLVTERGRLDPAEALRITSAVCDALGYAHEHGVIHRDIKPSNIMLDAHGAVKVADFGLAKSTAPETTMLTGSNISMGTPDFMAPESHFGAAQVDHRADIYAVGVMLYQMLTGRLPKGRFDPPSRAVPGLDKRLDAIVDKALQTDPASRYSSAIELRTAIEPILAKLGGTRRSARFGGTRRSARVSSGSGAPRSARGATRSTLAIVTVLAVLGIVAFFVFGKKEPQLREREPSAKPEQSSPALQRVEPSATDGRPDGLKPSTTLPAALSPSTEPWVDALADESRLFFSIKDIKVTPQGLQMPGSGTVKFLRGAAPGFYRDGAVRMLATYIPSKQGPFLYARTTDKSGALYKFGIILSNKAGLVLWDNVERKSRPIREFPLPRPLKPGEDYELELRVVGSNFTAKFNGRIIGEAIESSVAEGQFGIATTNDTPVLVKALEYLNLGSGASSSSPSPQVSPSPPFPPGKWTKVFTTLEELRAVAPDQKAFTWKDGWIDGTASPTEPYARVPGSSVRNGGIRLRGKIAEGVSGRITTACNVSVRNTGARGAASSYRITVRSLSTTAPNVAVSKYDGSIPKTEDLHVVHIDPKPQPGDEFDMELIAIGDKLYGKFNGKALPVVTDARLPEGELGFQTTHLVRDIEVLNLDGLSEAEARKAAGVEGK